MLSNFNLIYCNLDFISWCLAIDIRPSIDYIDSVVLIGVSIFLLPLVLFSAWQGVKEGAKKIGNVGSKAIITSAAGKKLYDDFVGGNGQGGNNNSGNTGNNQGQGNNNQGGSQGDNKGGKTGDGK